MNTNKMRGVSVSSFPLIEICTIKLSITLWVIRSYKLFLLGAKHIAKTVFTPQSLNSSASSEELLEALFRCHD